MANVDRPTGFRPVRYLDGSPYMGAANLYFSDSDNLFMGDLVIQDTAGTQYTKSNGIYGTVNRATAVTDLIVGVVVGWYPDPDNLGRLHHAASTSIPLLVAHIDNLVLECQSDDAETIAHENGKELRKLELPALNFDSEQSKFFKHHYKSGFNNKGIMERE